MQAAASSAHGRRLQTLSHHVTPRATATGGGNMAVDLSGRLCLVTGAGHGIGKHVAALLTELGGTVYGSDLRFDDFGAPLDGKDLKVSLADTAVVDITDQASVRSWVQRAEREQGSAVPPPCNNYLERWTVLYWRSVVRLLLIKTRIVWSRCMRWSTALVAWVATRRAERMAGSRSRP